MSLISYLTRIHFAEHVLEDALEAELDRLGLVRPLVVTDHGAARRAGLDRLLEAMPRRVAPALWTAPGPVATEAACAAAAAALRDAEADGVIGFGGRGAMALARTAGVAAAAPPPIGRQAGLGGLARIGPVPPLILIPTTAEACAEIDEPVAVARPDGPPATLEGPALRPCVVICDPTLTLDLAPERVAAAGMDTLTHCIETYIATAYNPPADGIARDGLRRAAAHLERAGGAGLGPRRELMAAALDGALAGQKGLGAVHAMTHALAPLAGGLDHGAANAVLLPHVLAFNAPAVAARYQEIKPDLGLRPREDLAEALDRLRARLGLPGGLGALGLAAADLEAAARDATAGHANRTNPRRAGTGDYLAMLRAAL